MQKTITTKLKIDSWDEKPYRELEEGSKFSRAEVTLSGSEDGLTSATSESLLFYRADGSSSFVTLMRVTGALDGRSGSFVLEGHGTYDGTTARVEHHVIDGSGTGELAGLRGTGESVSTHADYPFMPLTLEYDIE
jgi:Protein of unknown function (DUF3224)